MKNEKKISFTWKGLTFKNISVIISPPDKWGSSYGYAPMKGVSAVIRQYIKQKFPDVPFQISTDSFAGGDSVGIYLSPVHVSEEQYREIEEALQIFEKGTFNGMTDSFDYKKKSGISGIVEEHKITFNTKFLSVNYRPKYGTKAYDEYEGYGQLKYHFEDLEIIRRMV